MRSRRLLRVQHCMERFVSPILVRGVLQKTLATRGLTPQTAGDDVVPSLVEDCMIGLRLFVEEGRLPALMLELADILEA
jgi:hypothetical protein